MNNSRRDSALDAHVRQHAAEQSSGGGGLGVILWLWLLVFVVGAYKLGAWALGRLSEVTP